MCCITSLHMHACFTDYAHPHEHLNWTKTKKKVVKIGFFLLGLSFSLRFSTRDVRSYEKEIEDGAGRDGKESTNEK